MFRIGLLYILFYLESTLSVPPVDPPVVPPLTLEELNKSLLTMTNTIMENVLKIVTTNEASSVAALKTEIQTQQGLEEANNLKRFAEIQKQLKELGTTCSGKPTDPEVPDVNQQVITTYIIPIFLRQLRCGTCCGCSGGDVCYYYLFIYVIPLLSNSTGGGPLPATGTVPNTGSTQLNTLLQTLLGGLGGKGGTLPTNVLPQQPSTALGNTNLLGALFNYIFRKNPATRQAAAPTQAQADRCCPPCPPCPPLPPFPPIIPPLPPIIPPIIPPFPPIIPPLDPYGPFPPVDPYGPLPPDPYGPLPPDPCCPIPPVYGELPQRAGVQTREFGTNYGRRY